MVEEPLNRLYFHKYRINLQAKELIHLPTYKGSALRGVFGYALKRVVCAIKNSRCDTCILRLKCVYSSIMETPIPEDHPDHRKYKNAPHPYIIIPPLTGRQYFKPDDPISFEIVLIGRANEYLPYFVYAFTEMGRMGIGKDRGEFDVTSVEALNLDGSGMEIFSGNTGILRGTENRIDYSHFLNSPSPQPSPIKGEGGSHEITVSFDTPARIKADDRLSSDIPFNLLIRRLSERAFLLAHFHCGAEMGDYEEYAKGSETVETVSNKLRWIDWERYSSRQQTKMKLGGWVGEITYRGDLKKHLPLLRLGEHIHVGKATTFGLGRYRITAHPPSPNPSHQGRGTNAIPSPLGGEG
ncbi:MAG TPA: CRISPR system precrRNA processing endoribonuclease RAMP protein Cas6 [Proteobacteria bacterium]|nr:CRISPR system precrRNA processing endoribonuclease RAMP protein Cas6 [Pseudomonadota bacterium]